MEYKIGMIVKIINMKGEPEYQGKVGKITFIDAIGQLHGSWGGCAIVPDVDEFEVLSGGEDE